MLAQRLQKTREQLKAQSVDALALVPGFNMRYLTGKDFHLMERAFMLFITVDAAATPVLLIPDLEVLKWQHAAPFEAQLFPWNDKDGPADAMREATKALPEIHKLAVEHLRMRVMEYNLVKRNLPNIIISEAEAILDPLRMQKDAAEIDAMRRAVKVSEAALEEVIAGVKVGDTERQIAGRLSSALLNNGAEALSFGPIVLSGPNSALPHGEPGDRALQAGELLLIDFGGVVDGYYADITRTFVVGGEPEQKVRDMYAAVLAGNAAGREAVKPGVTCHALDDAARQAITNMGFGDEFRHRLGHGLGLDIHEAPSVMQNNMTQVGVGATFTIEPGAYIEGYGGIRIEDNVVVTESGGESLTTFPRELRIIGV